MHSLQKEAIFPHQEKQLADLFYDMDNLMKMMMTIFSFAMYSNYCQLFQ